MRLILLTAFAVLPLVAQGPPPERPGRGRRHGGQAMLERLHQLRLERLQQSMHLPEDTARALVDRWTAFDRESMERMRQIRHLHRRFEEILQGPGSDEDKNGRLRPLLEQFFTLRRQQMDLKHRFEEETRTLLQPAQQVRFILLMEDFQKDLRETLAQTLQEGRSGRGRP